MLRAYQKRISVFLVQEVITARAVARHPQLAYVLLAITVLMVLM